MNKGETFAYRVRHSSFTPYLSRFAMQVATMRIGS